MRPNGLRPPRTAIMTGMATVVLDANDMRRTLGRMAHEILEANKGLEDLVVVGILRRGWPIAKRLAFLLTQIEGVTVPCGKLDISDFRDDGRPRAARRARYRSP